MSSWAGGPLLGQLLRELQDRSGFTNVALAEALGVSPVTVARWRAGSARPTAGHLTRMAGLLGPVDQRTGQSRPLDHETVVKLFAAAQYRYTGQLADAGVAPSDRVEYTDRCAVYSYLNRRQDFPSEWSRRVVAVEEQAAGPALTMWNGLPSITRPPEFYWATCSDLYEAERITDYMDQHRSRRAAFRERLTRCDVRHLYAREAVDGYVKGHLDQCRQESGRESRRSRVSRAQADPFWGDISRDWRYRGLTDEVLMAQLETIVDWLESAETGENFRVRLTTRTIPINAMIFENVVLCQFDQYQELVRGQSNLMGMEVIGDSATHSFSRQFDSIWGDRSSTTAGNAEAIRYFKEKIARVREGVTT
jgi:transcriptional regulator with XRE-family HTH domain